MGNLAYCCLACSACSACSASSPGYRPSLINPSLLDLGLPPALVRHRHPSFVQRLEVVVHPAVPPSATSFEVAVAVQRFHPYLEVIFLVCLGPGYQCAGLADGFAAKAVGAVVAAAAATAAVVVEWKVLVVVEEAVVEASVVAAVVAVTEVESMAVEK